MDLQIKEFINEEKESISNFGAKALEEVESIASDVFKKVGTEVNDIATGTLSFIRKNPVIAVAAAVTIGIIIAKIIQAPHTDSKASTKRMAH